MRNTFSGKLFLFLIVISSSMIIFGMIVLNNNVTNIGIIELNGFLNEMNREISDVDYLGMVSKFKLHMDFYKDNIDQQEFDKNELRVAMVISGYENTISIYSRKDSGFTRFLLIIINLMRKLIDKPPLLQDYYNPTDNDLSLAYYYERNNYYDKALTVYNRALKKENLDKKKIPVINIHRSFCLALLRKVEEAKTLLKDVINQYSNENLALTAATLLQYIIYFEQEINKTKESGESALNKSEKLYKLIAYDDAIEILNQLSLEDEGQKDKIQYLKARCYEEVGEKEKSLEIYQEIIEENADSETAKLANNRILIMGTKDKELEELTEIAKDNNEKIKDTEFTEILDVAEQYKETTKDELIDDTILDEEAESTPEGQTPVPAETPFYTDAPRETPAETATPVPTQTRTPVPAETATPVPTQTRTPVPAETETPVPAQTRPPVPAETETPVPAQT
ncbi:MAG: tetratricopeptide repeat protein, partial [Spirochaetales bacterium]|nr:tetratricopeptide repeat protein [Spirochaetales bacterium]